MEHRYEDLTGNRYGKLTVLSWAYSRKKQTYWKCRCDCGNEIITQRAGLLNGSTKSCGCYNADKQRTHSMSNTRIYNIWQMMKARCCRKTSRAYKDYGGRGIKIIEEWKRFEPFYDWSIKNCYNETLTIDRIDVNGDYCPENCRWVTMDVQRKNKRDSLKIKGEPLKNICAKTGVSYKLVWKYKNSGKTLEESLATAIKNKLKKIDKHIQRLGDEEQTAEVIAEIANLVAERKAKVEEIKARYPYPVVEESSATVSEMEKVDIVD